MDLTDLLKQSEELDTQQEYSLPEMKEPESVEAQEEDTEIENESELEAEEIPSVGSTEDKQEEIPDIRAGEDQGFADVTAEEPETVAFDGPAEETVTGELVGGDPPELPSVETDQADYEEIPDVRAESHATDLPDPDRVDEIEQTDEEVLEPEVQQDEMPEIASEEQQVSELPEVTGAEDASLDMTSEEPSSHQGDFTLPEVRIQGYDFDKQINSIYSQQSQQLIEFAMQDSRSIEEISANVRGLVAHEFQPQNQFSVSEATMHDELNRMITEQRMLESF